MKTIREALETIINKADYTTGACAMDAAISVAVPQEDLLYAHLARTQDTDAALADSQALSMLLTQIDYTRGACNSFEMVGACLPQDTIVDVRTLMNPPPDTEQPGP